MSKKQYSWISGRAENKTNSKIPYKFKEVGAQLHMSSNINIEYYTIKQVLTLCKLSCRLKSQTVIEIIFSTQWINLYIYILNF